MKNNKNLKYIFIIVIVILLFLVGGATYFLKDSGESVLLETNIDNTPTLNSEDIPSNNDGEDIVSPTKEVVVEPTSTTIIQNTEKIVVKETPKVVLPDLTLSIIKGLVSKSWRKCPSTDCKSVEVSLGMDNLVTAVYTDISNSVAQSKFEGFVKAKDNSWILGEPFITRTCNREHSDGTFGFSESPCI